MKKVLFVTLIILLYVCMTFGQEVKKTAGMKQERSVLYSGYIADALTHEAVDSGKICLLAAQDSTLLLSTTLYTYNYSPEKRVTAFSIPLTKPGRFLLRVEVTGYQPKTVTFEVKRFYKNESSIERERPIYLHRLPKVRTLDEVTVKATRIKFFQNGDTLVFNADAFEMPDGSLLDALIRNMPGVRLKPGGEIEVNGRRVDELLLNGKNFFNKDRELLLENLPSYMVQTLNVYERVDEQYRGSGFADFAERQYVMDVRLKREYQVGWTGNAEGGIGKELGLARAFALRFTPHSRAFLFMNTNNVNDDRKPGQDGTWSPLSQRQGLLTTCDVGGNVFVEQKDNRWSYEGDLRYTYSDLDTRSHTASETFLPDGSTFGRALSMTRSYDHRLRTQHQLSASGRGWKWFGWMKSPFLWVFPDMEWHQWVKHSSSANAEFLDRAAERWGKAWTDSLLAPTAGYLLRTLALHRTLNEARGTGHSLRIGVTWNLQFSPSHNDNLEFQFMGSADYNRTRQRDGDTYLLEYFREPTSDLRNRFDNRDEHKASLWLEPSMRWRLGMFNSIGLAYHFTSSMRQSNRDFYLQHLSEDTVLADHDAMSFYLPSTDLLMQALDVGNSPHAHTSVLHNEAKLKYNYAKYTNTQERAFSVELPLRFATERLRYQRAALDTTCHRTIPLFQPQIRFRQKQRGGQHQLTASYELSVTPPVLTTLINVRDDSNPLSVILGNPDLTSTTTHRLAAEFRDRLPIGRWLHKEGIPSTLYHADASFSAQQRAIAYALFFDRQTGVRTIIPQNVDGNWQTHFRLGFTQPLDRQQHFTLDADAWMDHYHSVDLMDNEQSTVRSTFHNLTLRLDYRPSSRLHLGVKGDLHTQRSTSTRADFHPIRITDFDYGVLATAELPWGFQLASDLTMYSRRGYSDASLRSNELVWNARLTKRFLHGNLLCQLDAFDLLGRLSSVRRTINAQGRTETWANVMPRYALLHITYRLSKSPKNKPTH